MQGGSLDNSNPALYSEATKVVANAVRQGLSLLHRDSLEWNLQGKNEMRPQPGTPVLRPYSSAQGNLTAREASLEVLGNEDQWETLKKEMRTSGMSTNLGMKQLLLRQLLQARLDDEKNQQALRRKSCTRRLQQSDLSLSFKNNLQRHTTCSEDKEGRVRSCGPLPMTARISFSPPVA